MPSRQTGHVSFKHDLSATLTVFRILPATGQKFPSYEAGQYIALGRDDVPLTKKVGTDETGRPVFGPDIEATGHQRVGPVMHSYSIASAPAETDTSGFLEFYVAQAVSKGVPGRLSTALLGMPCGTNEPVNYVDRIVGQFTLKRLVGHATHVFLIGTGTGLAPLVSIVKQLDHDARSGMRGESRDHHLNRAFTLLHTNRTHAELGYHQELLGIEASGHFDFLYIPTVSRPTQRDIDDPLVGVGRATNILRRLYELSTTEEEAIATTPAGSAERTAAEAAALATPAPVLPDKLSVHSLRDRLDPTQTVIMACGNPASTSDIQHTAGRVHIPVHVEAW